MGLEGKTNYFSQATTWDLLIVFSQNPHIFSSLPTSHPQRNGSPQDKGRTWFSQSQSPPLSHLKKPVKTWLLSQSSLMSHSCPEDRKVQKWSLSGPALGMQYRLVVRSMVFWDPQSGLESRHFQAVTKSFWSSVSRVQKDDKSTCLRVVAIIQCDVWHIVAAQ